MDREPGKAVIPSIMLRALMAPMVASRVIGTAEITQGEEIGVGGRCPRSWNRPQKHHGQTHGSLDAKRIL